MYTALYDTSCQAPKVPVRIEGRDTEELKHRTEKETISLGWSSIAGAISHCEGSSTEKSFTIHTIVIDGVLKEKGATDLLALHTPARFQPQKMRTRIPVRRGRPQRRQRTVCRHQYWPHSKKLLRQKRLLPLQ